MKNMLNFFKKQQQEAATQARRHQTGNEEREATQLVWRDRQLASIIFFSADAIISKKPDGTILTWNKAAENIFGYKATEIIGAHISKLLPAGKQDEEAILINKLLAEGKIEQFETTRVKKDGTLIPVCISLSVIKDSTGAVIAVSTVLRDITALVEARQAERRSNERNRIFVEQAPTAMAMFDKNMLYMAASEKWRSMYHLGSIELVGKSHYEIFPEIGDDWKKIHQEALTGKINTCDEASFVRADGSTQWISWEVRPWYLEKDLIGGIIMYTADITAAKEKDAERRKIDVILERANRIAQIATWDVDMVAGTSVWNETANQIFELPEGYQPNATKTLTHFTEESKERVIAATKALVETGKAYDLELQIITGKGNPKWIRMIGEGVFENGTCVRRFGLIQDITKSRLEAQKLFYANAELNAIFNSGKLAIIGTDKEGLITHFNKAAEQMLGYSAEEMIGIHTPALIHVADEVIARGIELSNLFQKQLQGFDVFVEYARQGKYESREWTYVRKDGSTFPVQLIVTALQNKAGEITGFLGVGTDITEQKIVARQLDESRKQFEAFMDTMPAMCWIVDDEGTFQFANSLYETTFSLPNLVGINFNNIFPRAIAQEYQRNNDIVFSTDTVLETIEPSVKPDGTNLTLKIYKFPLGTRNGKKLLGGIAVDITQQVESETELRRLNDQLTVSNKELEQFAFVASHDLKEPLRMVASFLQLLQKKYEKALDEKAQQYISIAVDGAQRMSGLINDLLSFSKIGTDGKLHTNINISTVISRVTRMFEETIQQNQAIINVAEMPVINGHPFQIEQLFQNLVGNALKYSKPAGVQVDIGFTENNKGWTFFVKDNGIGIDSQYTDKIFVIFQRLHNKNEYSGTGIGLAICKKIVEQHGGQIWVESEAGKGSTFYFTILKN